MEKEYEWTIQQETALNVFAEFMANMIEKYGPLIDAEKVELNIDKGDKRAS